MRSRRRLDSRSARPLAGGPRVRASVRRAEVGPDGVETCSREGVVAFGSNAWELFESEGFPLDAGDDVLIYASHAGTPAVPRVTWRAQFGRYQRTEHYRGAELRRIRPPSTRAEDAQAPWSGFYEVRSLRRLEPDEELPILGLRDQHGRRYRSGFFPEGPIVITAP